MTVIDCALTGNKIKAGDEMHHRGIRFKERYIIFLGQILRKKSVGSKDGFQNYEPNQGFFAKKKS